MPEESECGTTVKRALHDLTGKGYLVKEEHHRSSGSRTSNLYIVR